MKDMTATLTAKGNAVLFSAYAASAILPRAAEIDELGCNDMAIGDKVKN
jgi:hypothetical protein